MGVYDLFSKRQRRARGEIPDVYKYDDLPHPLRVQIVHIIGDAIGADPYGKDYAKKAYEYLNSILCREYGVFELVNNQRSYKNAVINFFLCEQSTERALDVIELCFRYINSHIRNNENYRWNTNRKIQPDDAVAELNVRFKEHGVGYQFESNELFRVDSDFLHAEAVKPTLTVLRGKGFKGVNEEFLQAHEHYRHGRYKECLVDSLKSFESTMKAICMQRHWPTQPGDTSKTLISTCLAHGLLPQYMESQIGALRTLLESGVPTVRNKLGGHGQGPIPTIVPGYIARYALNLTASSILFLVEANSAKQ